MKKEEFIKWTKKMSVHIDNVDEQHKHLFGLINKAEKCFENGKREELKEVLNAVVEYTRVHFSTEERYFKKWDYPYARQHEAAHAKLVLSTLSYYDRFNNGEDIAYDFLVFLKGWWETHIKIHDHEYSEYFVEKGYIK